MTKYASGANFERRVKKHLEEKGYIVYRSAGSHSPADLIALRKEDKICDECCQTIWHTAVYLIQCKKTDSNLPEDEWNKLWKQAVNTDSIAVVAAAPKREIEFRFLIGEKEKGKPGVNIRGIRM